MPTDKNQTLEEVMQNMEPLQTGYSHEGATPSEEFMQSYEDNMKARQKLGISDKTMSDTEREAHRERLEKEVADSSFQASVDEASGQLAIVRRFRREPEVSLDFDDIIGSSNEKDLAEFEKQLAAQNKYIARTRQKEIKATYKRDLKNISKMGLKDKTEIARLKNEALNKKGAHLAMEEIIKEDQKLDRTRRLQIVRLNKSIRSLDGKIDASQPGEAQKQLQDERTQKMKRDDGQRRALIGNINKNQTEFLNNYGQHAKMFQLYATKRESQLTIGQEWVRPEYYGSRQRMTKETIAALSAEKIQVKATRVKSHVVLEKVAAKPTLRSSDPAKTVKAPEKSKDLSK